MNLSRRIVGIVITLMVVSLGGLVSLQVYLLTLAMEQKEQMFRRSVFAAMNTVSQRLEKTEAFTFALGSAGHTVANWHFNVSSSIPSARDSIQIQGLFMESEGMLDAQFDDCPISIVNGVMSYEITNPQHVMIKMYDQTQGIDHIVVDTFRTAGKYEVDLKNLPVSQSQVMYMYRSDSNSAIFQVREGSKLTSLAPMIARTNKEDYVRRVVTDLVVAELEPIEDRITQAELDTLIASALGESGINLAFTYGVFSGSNDSLRVASAIPAREQLRKSEFRTRLFPNDMLSARSDLALHFPDRAVYLWKQMSVLVMTNLLFIGVIIAVFVYTLRVMLAQKRFSSRIVDFINNMTHEFKTPISTVALACEAIMRPDVIEQPERIGKYSRMILDENQRMRHQVEKILQMAVIEEGDYDLRLAEVDIHQIVRTAIEGISLQIENRKGKLTHTFGAENAVIMGDSLHLTNIINNLLDNANKYSPEAPEISVSTRNDANDLVVSISDKGLGIAESDQKAVFDKYFRVHSGNLHNVKGFGLGLSYVKMMVEAQHGRIRIESKPGEGTTIEMRFPSVVSAG